MENYGADFLRVMNVVERIGVKKQQIGDLALLHGALRLQLA